MRRGTFFHRVTCCSLLCPFLLGNAPSWSSVSLIATLRHCRPARSAATTLFVPDHIVAAVCAKPLAYGCCQRARVNLLLSLAAGFAMMPFQDPNCRADSMTQCDPTKPRSTCQESQLLAVCSRARAARPLRFWNST